MILSSATYTTITTWTAHEEPGGAKPIAHVIHRRLVLSVQPYFVLCCCDRVDVNDDPTKLSSALWLTTPLTRGKTSISHGLLCVIAHMREFLDLIQLSRFSSQSILSQIFSFSLLTALNDPLVTFL